MPASGRSHPLSVQSGAGAALYADILRALRQADVSPHSPASSVYSCLDNLKIFEQRYCHGYRPLRLAEVAEKMQSLQQPTPEHGAQGGE